MSVRGGKNKILLYVLGAFVIAVVILLYRHESQRLADMAASYKRCHMNEDSLSAQLQVILEYKVRLEKSLQQEKSDCALAKEELQTKMNEERELREHENMQSINKFTALQQQYKLLQSQHQDVESEYNKLRQLQLTESEDKSRLETQLQSLKDQLKLITDKKENDGKIWRVKETEMERENEQLKTDNKELASQLRALEADNERLQNGIGGNKPISSLKSKLGAGDVISKRSPSINKTSTSANKAEVYLSSNNMYVNTSTPMINPEAIQSQDKIFSVRPFPQPKPESSSKKDEQLYDNKENVGAKPDELNDSPGGVGPQGFWKHWNHIPEVKNYNERLRIGERNNGGEVGDEGEPVKPPVPNEPRQWREREVDGQQQPVVRHPPVGQEIPRNQVYLDQAEYENRKEEEDDDDVDQIEYRNPNEKNEPEAKEKIHQHIRVKQINDKQDSVMVQPK